MSFESIKNWMGPYQRTPKTATRSIKYPGLGVRSVGLVGDFLDWVPDKIYLSCIYIYRYMYIYICVCFLSWTVERCACPLFLLAKPISPHPHPPNQPKELSHMHHKHKHKTTCWGMRWHGQCYCIRNCWNLSEPCHRRCFQGAVNHVGKSSAGERVGVWKDTMLGFVEDTNIWKSAFKVTVLAKKRFIDFQYSWSRWSVNGQDTTSMYFYTEGIGPIKRCHFMLSDRMPMLARWCCRGPPWWHTDSALRWGKAVFFTERPWN